VACQKRVEWMIGVEVFTLTEVWPVHSLAAIFIDGASCHFWAHRRCKNGWRLRLLNSFAVADGLCLGRGRLFGW
jgi:hypothetical protein